jgi:hypothetical protein
MKDGRKLARGKSPIVCVPTFSYVESRGHMVASTFRRVHDLGRRVLGLGSKLPSRPSATPLRKSESAPAPAPARPEENVWADPPARRWSPWRSIEAWVFPQRNIADLSGLTFPQMKDMLKAIGSAAERSGWARVPVILENHTKDIGDFGPIEQFAEHVARAGYEVIRLSDLHRNLARGLYAPVTGA